LPIEPVVANINVPNTELDEILGWRRTRVEFEPIRGMSKAVLNPLEGRVGSYSVEFSYGEAMVLPEDTDGGAVEAGYVSVGYLSRLTADDRADLDAAEATLASLLDG
jgi:broad specificity polyphosphatase/5'/3'-nucleotidase SurE